MPLASPRFFKKPSDFRAWLQKNHATKTELIIGLYKAKAAHRGVTYKQAIDEALCFGWIDGVVKSIDDEQWMIRFTPRKPGSHWSKANIAKAKRLIASGAMTPAGLAAFEARDAATAGKKYSFENDEAHFSDDLERAFRRNTKAWQWFIAQAPSYQRTATFWVMSAKRDVTRDKRFAELLADSAKGRRVKPLRPYPRAK